MFDPGRGGIAEQFAARQRLAACGLLSLVRSIDEPPPVEKGRELGELRGFIAAEDGAAALDPATILERECARVWITSPIRALATLAHSPNVRGTEAAEWTWKASNAGTSLREAASIALPWTCSRSQG
jgi:hypothetical protein